MYLINIILNDDYEYHFYKILDSQFKIKNVSLKYLFDPSDEMSDINVSLAIDLNRII